MSVYKYVEHEAMNDNIIKRWLSKQKKTVEKFLWISRCDFCVNQEVIG